MKKTIKTICASIVLVMVASAVAQAGVSSTRAAISSCERAVLVKYNCGDDVYVPGSKEAICWANLHRGMKHCKTMKRIKGGAQTSTQTGTMKRAN